MVFDHMWCWLKGIVLLSCCLFTRALEPGVNYARPPSKVGVNDQNFVNLLGLDTATMHARNLVLDKSFTPGVHEYNGFWASFEVTHSQPAPFACDAGYMQVPADESGLLVNGGKYASYHCYSQGSTQQMQTSLQLDAAMGWHSSVVVWCAAAPFRDSMCKGQPEAATQSAPEDPPRGYTQYVQNTVTRTAQLQVQANTGVDGSTSTQSATDIAGCSCVPTLDSYPDFQDYMTFLGHNLSTPDAHFTDYIIFNEVDSAFWYDLSPRIDVSKELSSADIVVWQNSIIDMMNLAHNALASTPYPIMIYTSTDRYWGAAPTLQWNSERVHIGSKAVVDALLFAGPLLDWNFSVAVHPYSDPLSDDLDAKPAAYNYITLDAISHYLDFQLQVVGKNGSVLMAATEQGLQASLNNDTARAQWICQAHNITLNIPNLLYSAHNDLQRSTGARDDFSMIVSDNPLLTDTDNIVEYQAYKSTALTIWGQSSQHYCCSQHNLGCQV